MDNFKKIAELSSKDRTKVKSYWTELYGSEYANSMVTDYEPQGEKKEVAAKSKNKVK